jgi:cytochrome c5
MIGRIREEEQTMKSRKAWSLIIGAAAVAVLVACGAAFIAPDVSDDLVRIGQSKWPDASQASLQHGRDLFTASCGKGGFCHKLPTPKSRTVEQWNPIMVKMAKNAKLDDAQRESVLQFILAVRDLPPATTQPVTN